jgi:hypothetical protein
MARTTVGELLDRGELEPGTGVEVGDVQISRAGPGYYAGRRRPDGTWIYLWRETPASGPTRWGPAGEGTGYNRYGDDPPGFFPDLPTLIDHLFVATHGGSAETPAESA